MSPFHFLNCFRVSYTNESLPIGIDASKLDYYPQPSTSNSTLGNRSEEDEHSRDLQRSLSESGWQEESGSETSDHSGSRPNVKKRRRAVKVCLFLCFLVVYPINAYFFINLSIFLNIFLESKS